MNQLTDNQKHTFCNETLSFVDKIEENFLALAYRLYRIREDRLYEAGWGSFEEFCMERKGISKGTASKLITVYELYVLKHGVSSRKLIDAGGWSVLYAGRHLADTKAKALKFMEDASNMTLAHVHQTVKEAKTGISQTDCEHPNAYQLSVCPDCGEKHRI